MCGVLGESSFTREKRGRREADFTVLQRALLFECDHWGWEITNFVLGESFIGY